MKKILLMLLIMALSACGTKIEGTYSIEQGMSFTFNPDGTATFSAFPMKVPFEVNGNKVKLTGMQEDLILTILENGDLLWNGMEFKKATPPKPASTSAKVEPQDTKAPLEKTSIGDLSGEYVKENAVVNVKQQDGINFSINSAVGDHACDLEGKALMMSAQSAGFADKSSACAVRFDFIDGSLKVVTKDCDGYCGLNAAGSIDGSYQKK